jgi:hypothetical protein
MMNKLVIFVLLAVLTVSARGQRVPRGGAEQRSDRYVNKVVPKLLRGVVVNYARIGANASKGSRVPKPQQVKREPLELPKELSATGSQNMFANLTSDKFDFESETGATGGKTGATGATGPVVTVKKPVFTGPTGVETSIEYERKLRLLKANLTKNSTAKVDAANDVKKRLDDKSKKEKEQEEEKKEAKKADEADKALKNRIRKVEGKPAPVVPTKAINNGKNNSKNASVTGKSSDSKKNSSKSDGNGNRSNDSTEHRSLDEVDEVDEVVLKERIRRGEIKVNSTEKKKKVFVQKGAKGASGLPAVDLNKGNSYDPTLDGQPKQYYWVKNGKMGSSVYRQFLKLKASRNNYQSNLLNNIHTQKRL